MTIVAYLTVFLGLFLMFLALRRILLSLGAIFLYKVPTESGNTRYRFKVVCVCRNESRNLKRLISGLRSLSYDEKLLEIILVDDNSTDGTDLLIKEATSKQHNWRSILLIGCNPRGKAQALKEVLPSLLANDEDLIVILDADHILKANGLYRLCDYFRSDVGAVAFNHEVENKANSLVSVYCNLEAIVGEQITARGQTALGINTKLAGTFCTRYSLLKTHYPTYPNGLALADDVDFSTQLTSAGWKVIFAQDVISTHLVAETYSSYISQHIRWSGALYETSWINALAILKSKAKLSLTQRIEAIISVLGYFERPLIWIYILCATTSIFAGWNPILLSIPVVTLFIGMMTQIILGLWITGVGYRLWLLSFSSLGIAILDFAVTTWGLIRTIARKPTIWGERN